MPEVNRIGFTELGGSDGSKDNLQGIKKVKYGILIDVKKVQIDARQHRPRARLKGTSA